MINISIVSHGHALIIPPLLEQMLALDEVACIFVTHNIAEEHPIQAAGRVVVIDNPTPKGFGANHNAAFAMARQQGCRADYFCVLNPDISLIGNPFPALIAALQTPDMLMAGPQVLSPAHQIEDSARYFPTVTSLLKKAIGLLARGNGGAAPHDADPRERANLKDRQRDVFERLKKEWEAWDSTMLPERTQPAVFQNSGSNLADHYGVINPPKPAAR